MPYIVSGVPILSIISVFSLVYNVSLFESLTWLGYWIMIITSQLLFLAAMAFKILKGMVIIEDDSDIEPSDDNLSI